MDLIIDIQCCKNKKNKHIPKEVAVISKNGNHLAHWIIQSPHIAEKLPLEIKRENKWLRHNFHGLDMEDGFVSRTSFNKSLGNISKNFGKVFVRGKEKKQILQGIIPNEIINLEDDKENSSFNDLPLDDTFCIYHSTLFCHKTFNCALNNVVRLKKWMTSPTRDFKQVNNEQLRDIAFVITDTTSHCRSVCSG